MPTVGVTRDGEAATANLGRWSAIRTSTASSRCSPRGGRRAPSTPTAATSPRSARYLGKPLAQATLEELERYTAQLRADGLAGATIARRTAAARSFFRHLQLLGARDDNPAAGVKLPRRATPAAADALARARPSG